MGLACPLEDSQKVWLGFSDNYNHGGYNNLKNKKYYSSTSHHLERLEYCTPTIITRGLYTFYPLFEVQTRFSMGFFLKILVLCMVSI